VVEGRQCHREWNAGALRRGGRGDVAAPAGLASGKASAGFSDGRLGARSARKSLLDNSMTFWFYNDIVR
jgi:hypothetical protein